MCVIDQPSKWEDCIHLVEVSYNNGYQASLKMSHVLGIGWKKSVTHM